MDSLNERSKSKSQQRLFGMVHAYQSGGLKLSDLPKSLAKKVKRIADGGKRKTGDKRKKTKGISKKDAEMFASTKHKGLPEKVKKENIIYKFSDYIMEEFVNREEQNLVYLPSVSCYFSEELLEVYPEDSKTGEPILNPSTAMNLSQFKNSKLFDQISDDDLDKIDMFMYESKDIIKFENFKPKKVQRDNEN